MSTIEIIRWFALFVFGVSAAVSLISFYYDYPLNLKLLSILWMLLFLIDVFGNMLGRMHMQNYWLYNIFSWIWYPSLAYLYSRKLKSQLIGNIILLFLMVFPLIIIVDSIFIEGIINLQSFIIVFGGAFVVFMAAAYFRQLYLSEENQNITGDAWFWFSFGFIVYFAGGSVPFLGMLNYLTIHDQQFAADYYYYIYLSFTILLHLLILTGFLCRTNYQKSH